MLRILSLSQSMNNWYIAMILCPNLYRDIKPTWSGARLRGGRKSSTSLISSLYPNFRRIVHMWMMCVWTVTDPWCNRNPFKVRPRSLTPSGSLSCTVFFRATISDGWRGTPKDLTCWQSTGTQSTRLLSVNNKGSKDTI